MKRPSFQFYPGDWLRSTDLRTCSIGARGLWIDMLCLMHDGNPYGHLRVGDKDILPDTLARIVGGVLPEIERWLAELEQAGVCSRTQEGTIFSRRMVRDEEIRAKRSAGGEKSLLNPNVPRRKGYPSGVSLRGSLGGSPATASASAIKDLASPSAQPATVLTTSIDSLTDKPTPVTNTNTPKATRFKLENLAPDERATWFEFCRAERPDLDPVKTLDSFSDFWKARPGSAGLKLDWQATWRNWVRKEKPGPGGGSGQPTSKQMQGIMALERMKNGENPYGAGAVVQGRDIDGTATVVQPEPPRVSFG